MGGGKVCKMGHAYASYFTDCPFCVSKAARAAASKPKSVTVTPKQEPLTVTVTVGGEPVTTINRVWERVVARPKRQHTARQRAYRQGKAGAPPGEE